MQWINISSRLANYLDEAWWKKMTSMIKMESGVNNKDQDQDQDKDDIVKDEEIYAGTVAIGRKLVLLTRANVCTYTGLIACLSLNIQCEIFIRS